MSGKKEKLSLKESWGIFIKALKISLKTKTRPSIIVSLIGFPMALLPMFISLTVKKFANEAQGLYSGQIGDFSQVLWTFALLSALYIAQLVYNSAGEYFARTDSLRINRYMRERILRCCCDVKYKYIDNYDDFKEKINFIDTDAGPRVAGSIQSIFAWIQSVITFISILVVLLDVNVWVMVVLLAACVPAVVLSYFQKDEEYRQKTMWIYDSLMACSIFFESVRLTSINDVRFFGIYKHLLKKFHFYNDKYLITKKKMTRKHVVYNSIADVFKSSVYIVILLITAARIFENPSVGIGAFMLVFTLAGQLQDVTAKIFIAVAKFASDISYMNDFFYLDTLEYEERDPNASPRAQYEIDVKNISFSYPDSDRTILKDISITIKEGEKIAIVGENGSGKSTFVHLLCAVYDPDKGEITIGGEDIHTNLSSARRTISAVFQDFSRYEATLRENITISDHKKSVSDIELRELAERMGAWEFIEPQASGFDEAVGSFSDTGNNLSGGQWQKIAITRCAYRDDAKIMILDEPTAALDPIAEADLYRSFASLTGDRTTILISHRLGITGLVDRVLVFDDGRIVEDGNHEELMAQKGIYSRMYEAQAQWYQ